MCLVVSIEVPYERRAELAAASPPADEDRVQLYVHPDRRWWLSRWLGAPDLAYADLGPEESGCGCGFLNDDADWNADYWAMDEEMRVRLASALSRVVGSLAGDAFVKVMWSGDKVREDRTLSLGELSELALRGELGTHTRYRVTHRTAASG